MATVAEFTVPGDEFPLGTIFRGHPAATVELDRLVPTNHAIIPYFWVYDVELEDVESEFSTHPGVSAIRLVDSVDGTHLLRVEWAPKYHGVLSVIAETQTALLSVIGTAEEWIFEVRGDDREYIADLQERLREQDIPVSLSDVHDLRPVTSSEYGLTDAQRRTLTLAHEYGFFKTPREITMEELAGELGISRQALGSRIRRGLDRLVDGTLLQPGGEKVE